MSLTLLSLLLDVAFIILLVPVIFYAVRLNRHISQLQRDRQVLENLLRNFGQATEKAENAIRQMRQSTAENADSIEALEKKSSDLLADLKFLNERGEEIANRVETAIRNGRSLAPRASEPMLDDEEPAKGKASSTKQPAATRNSAARRPLRADKSVDGAFADAAEEKPQKAKSKNDLLKALQGMR